MAEEPKSTEGAGAKKAAKKLVIIDGNDEQVPAPKQAKKIEIAAETGDTPQVSSEEPQPQTVEESKVEEIIPEEQIVADVPLPKTITIADAIDAAAVTETTPGVENTEAEVPETQEPADTTTEPSEVLPEAPTEEAEASEPDISENSEEFGDTETVEAVDDIVATESDELLQSQDQLAEQVVAPEKKSGKLKEVFKNWWKNPATKWGTIIGLLVVLLGIGVFPGTRYAILNAFGVRASSSLSVINNETQQPLKNANVSFAGQTATTDDKGVASFTKLKLGKAKLVIQKRGYSTLEQAKTLGWGSNPLGQLALGVTGSQFSFVVKDYFSGKAVLGAEAVSGDFNAQSDAEGKVVLPVDKDIEGDLEVTIKATDYRDEKVTVKQTDTAEKNVQMVPSHKHVFVSKRSGKLDIYKIDADAKNESVLLAATGTERDDLAVLPHPTKNFAAIVSTREGKRNKDGYLLSTLYVVNVANGELTKITQSERIQLIDWTGDRVVYIAVTEGASAANAARSKLLSFEIGQPGPKEIASANYFNDAVVFKGAIYYAPSSYAVPVANVKFFRVNPDGTNLATLLDKEVWNIFKSDYDTLQLSVQQDWYELKGSGTPTKLAAAPANPRSRTYKDSPDKKHALWVDTRDGKGVLLSYNTETKADDTLQTQAGLTSPVNWLNNTTFVYRVSDGREVADYVKSTEGGEAKKLRDVTNTDFANYFNY